MYSEASSRNSEDTDYDTQLLLASEKTSEQHRKQQKRSWIFFATNALIFFLNIGLLLMISSPRDSLTCDGATTVQLPHAEWIAPAIELELQDFDDKFAIHGKYRGKPRPELEEAWAEYVRNYTLRVPKPGWMNATEGASLAEFQDEEGGIMGVFAYIHNVHCLKTIRQWMLPEYYPETREQYPPTEDAPLPRHIDHCIDVLRQSELCHADMTLMISEWHEDMPHPIPIHHAKHVCNNPNKMEAFLEKHTVPPIGPILRHPWTGEIPWPLDV